MYACDLMPSEYAHLVGEAISAAMRMRRMKQADLARESGVPESTLSHYIRGTQDKPNAETLLKIARALRVPVGFLADPQPSYTDSAEELVRFERAQRLAEGGGE
jgi:transcriptional regulator with XRE-family HTH domain